MLISNYISQAIPCIHLYDSVETTLFWMNLLNVHELVVVDQNKLLGIVHFDFLSINENSDIATALKYKPELNNISVFHDQHIFDAVKIMQENHLSIIPVINHDESYFGSVTAKDLVRCLYEVINAKEPGDIIILEVQPQDLLIREVASIIESDGGKILNIHTSTLTSDRTMYVNIKLGRCEIDPILASLERHGYKIAYTFADSTFKKDTQDHYESLMRFLSI